MSAGINAMTVPKLGLTMKEGSIAAWHVDVGAPVAVDQPVFDVETEKVTHECVAESAGVLRRQLAAQGTKLPVGALVAVIAPPEVSEPELDRFVASFKPEQQA